MNKLQSVIKAILLTVDAPISGYDITKMIQNKTGNTHQQVYRELARMAKLDGVAVELVIQEDRPDKKMYSIEGKDTGVFWSEKQVKLRGDYSKTSLAYKILVRDILDGTNNFDNYIKAMDEAECSFLDSIGD